MDTKTIKIDASVHRAIKEYCNKEGLKLAKFIEKVCLKQIKENGSDE